MESKAQRTKCVDIFDRVFLALDIHSDFVKEHLVKCIMHQNKTPNIDTPPSPDERHTMKKSE